MVTIPDPKTGGTTVNTVDTTRITVRTCNYTQVRVNFTDPDNITTPTHPAVSPLQNLTVTYTGNGTINFNQLQNGDIGTFQLLGDGTPNPQGIFYFQPGSSYAGQTIRIALRIEDNACPVKGIQTRIIEIKIVPGPFAIAAGITGANGIGNLPAPNGTRTICPGGGADAARQGGAARTRFGAWPRAPRSCRSTPTSGAWPARGATACRR